jgi:transposase
MLDELKGPLRRSNERPQTIKSSQRIAQMPISTPALRCIGCDVGKARIVVFDSQTQKISTIENQPQALANFAARLDASCFVVCEATGGYESGLLTALVAAQIPAHRADARKVKAFIRSFGTLGKTDGIDARALTRYGLERSDRLPRWQAPDKVREQLQHLVLARRDLVADRQAYANRLAAPGAESVKPFLAPIAQDLAEQIAAIDDAIKALISTQPELKAATDTLCTVAGMGATTAAALLALMPELGQLDRKQAAALAGLAPHPKQSGISDAYRRTRGGRPQIKPMLFMAAMSAAMHNKTLKAFYQKLLAAGKKPILAITAVMRKLIVICNALLRNAYATI